MEREIPLYSYDGQLLQWVDTKRLDRLVTMDRVSRVVKHPKGRIARAILRHMPGEPPPSLLPEQVIGTLAWAPAALAPGGDDAPVGEGYLLIQAMRIRVPAGSLELRNDELPACVGFVGHDGLE